MVNGELGMVNCEWDGYPGLRANGFPLTTCGNDGVGEWRRRWVV